MEQRIIKYNNEVYIVQGNDEHDVTSKAKKIYSGDTDGFMTVTALQSEVSRLEGLNRETLEWMRKAKILLFRMEFGGEPVNESDFYKELCALLSRASSKEQI